MDIKPGDMIQASRWAEPVEAIMIQEMGDYVRFVGVSARSRKHIDQLIHKNEMTDLKVGKIESQFTADPLHVFLSLETKRYRYASLYDPLLAMNTSKVDPLPHQIEAVYGYALKLPRIRFLIADDPGAGKTVMAGLIIKELKLRHLVNRILIVVPGHLKDQWRRELKERFEEHFVIIDRGFLDGFYGENAWDRESQVIASIDFSKRDEILPSLAGTHFDLVIADEAHKMAAYRYGDKLEKTSRYKLGETLSRISNHLLFLTATPHKGDPENFRLFLDLLEPGFFATAEMLQESISKRENPLFIRRVKEDLKDFDGKPLFLPRQVQTLPFNLGSESPSEKLLYNELSKYVNTQYNKALSKDKKRNVAFALVILQRRFASSTYALLRSLERRLKRLVDLYNGVQETKKDEPHFDFESFDDMSEEDRWKEEELWETLSVAENREELQKEIQILEELAQKARKIIENDEEVKLRELKKTFQNLEKKFPGQKILIFTESRDTLDYLSKRIASWGYTANVIHGGMRLQERVKAESIFKNQTQVLIATEAAGEGINLQFCNLMINYDIPWNPNRLEQRMGRIHRYGQTREVFVFNLVAEDTREGRVLKRLFEKIEEIKNALGNDKVFDVLSEVLYGKNLSQILLDAAANARNIDEILSEIEINVDEEYISKVKENLGESLATRYIDYTRIKEMADRARESRLIPEYTEAFFRKAFDVLQGKIKDRKDSFLAIENVPYMIRQIANDDIFKKRYGSILRSYPKATFDKEKAFKNPDGEFICFGHPLFESVLSWVENDLSTSMSQGALFHDPDGKLNGYILFYEAEIMDGKGVVAGKRLFAFYVDDVLEIIRPINPACIWDLAQTNNRTTQTVDLPHVDIEGVKNKVIIHFIPVLESYRKELTEERLRQTKIKEKYGVQSLDHLILRLDGDLISLYDRQARGENVDLVIRNKEELKKHYESALIHLQQTIEQEKILTMSHPTFIGAIRVIPQISTDPSMKSDAEVERIGMEVTIKYEVEHGRAPEDVSLENLGYDIRSTDSDKNKRYIEVKARAKMGAICITQNEWFKAKRFGEDYYLYVVFNACSSPQLQVIKNPASVLSPEERVESVRFIVNAEQIIEHTVM